MTVPVILEEISLLPKSQGVEALLSMQFVACGGGPLKLSVGNKLAAAGVKVLSHYGATEVGPLAPIFAPTPEYDWHYFRLRQDMNIVLELVESSEQETTGYYKLTTYPFGWDRSFQLQDRLLTSPQNPGIDFKAVGRTDDLIILATGEKVRPTILESMLTESPLVKTAIAFGDGQFELGVIVEPASPSMDDEQFKQSIWPDILKAGDEMDDHARITSKTSIILLLPGQSIPRSDKGSVLRREAYRIFDPEIKKVYRDLDDSTIETSHYSLDIQNLEESLKRLIQTHLSWTPRIEDWSFTDDFFELGMNSLQVLRLRRLLLSSTANNAAFIPAEKVTIGFVYENSSIAKIADALTDRRRLGTVQTFHEREIEDFVSLYSLKLPISRLPGQEAGSVVLLTGTTGSLGAHILAKIVNLSSVVRVICLNRPGVDAKHRQDPYERQFNVLEGKGVALPLQDKLKVEVIETDLGAPRLGLNDTQFATLRGTITHILHSAWPMDFKRMLNSFESQFRLLHNLLNLAKDVHRVRPLVKPRLLFVSSIAVVGQYPRVHGVRMVPEVPMKDSQCTNHFGYGEAKLVCERIIEITARTHQEEMEALYVRVGQMSGSRQSGYWNPNEHFPALVKLSQNIMRLPDIEGVSGRVRAMRSLELTSLNTANMAIDSFMDTSGLCCGNPNRTPPGGSPG